MPNLSLAVRIFLATLTVFLPLQGLDQWLYDQTFRLRGKQTHATPVVLVRISEAKLRQLLADEGLGPRPPKDEFTIERRTHPVWHETFYRRLLSNIRRDNPQVIVFNTFFEWLDQEEKAESPHPDTIFSALIDDENRIVPPPARLIPSEHYGFNALFPDADNVVRSARLIYSGARSLALEVYYQLFRRLPDRSLVMPYRIDYRGPARSFPSVDGWDIYENLVREGFFKDKIVLIGREGSPSNDLETPFGKMSRLEIQANAISTFTEGREIRLVPPLTARVLSLAMVGLSVFLILSFPLSAAWVLLIILAGGLLLASVLTLGLGKLYLAIANPIVSILGTHMLLIGYKIGRQEEAQWRIQEETKYLKEMDQFKNNFISLFSHDLKTPIAKIKAITDSILTENPNLPASVSESLQSIDRTNSELSRLISDILRVTKMESMKWEAAREVVDINRLVETSAQRLRFHADRRNIKLKLDLEPLFSMEGDPKLLQEVITNLVENAIKYSTPDTTVTIRTREKDERVEVSVEDQGPGIPADELPRITSKFYRGKSGIDSAPGSGLGLYLAKYFVELHRGTLSIKSSLGKGTEVSFSLPL